MIEENWLIKTNVNLLYPFERAIEQRKEMIDVSGKTSAIGPNTQQFKLNGVDEYMTVLINWIKKNVPNNTNLDVALFDKIKSHSCWIVKGQEGSYHRSHRHGEDGSDHVRNNRGISTVLYVDVPFNTDKGDFYFLLEKNTGTKLHVIKPQIGDLLIFPWSLYHGVYPQGSGLRKSINCDFDFK